MDATFLLRIAGGFVLCGASFAGMALFTTVVLAQPAKVSVPDLVSWCGQAKARPSGITAEQKSQVASILAVEAPQIEQQRQTVQSAREKVFQTLRSDAFDEAQTRAATEELAAAQETLFVSIGRAAEEIRPLLTQEQKGRADALRLLLPSRGGSAL